MDETDEADNNAKVKGNDENYIENSTGENQTNDAVCGIVNNTISCINNETAYLKEIINAKEIIIKELRIQRSY